MILSLTILISCQTDREENNQNSVYLNLQTPLFPEALDIQSLSTENKRLVLNYMVEMYSAHLQLLLTCKTTKQFEEEALQAEIDYCQSVINWIYDIVNY